MDIEEKVALFRELGTLKGDGSRILKQLGIPRSTYYRWKRRYEREGIMGLRKKRGVERRIWNRLLPEECDRVVEIAKDHPELSCRLLAIKITDEEAFSVSGPTVYRLLKQRGLIEPRPIRDPPAAGEWHTKTRKVDAIWQSDATHYFVVGWGYYKQITVLDDYSRNPIAWDLKPDETAFSISDVVEMAIENARAQGHLVNGHRPMLLSDNGPGFTSKMLAAYLAAHGIKHIFGRPYHPQTQGKIERFHRSIKGKVCLMVYCSPEALRKAIDEAITTYAGLPHTALKNVSPRDVYAGRKEEILRKRAEKKRLTLERRKRYNLGVNHDGTT
jgi:transposase InsO family protein